MIDILTILQSKFTAPELAGYQNGLAAPDETYFVAYTLLPLSSEEFKYLHPLYLYNKGYSGRLTHNSDPDRTKKFNSDGSYQMKSLEECIAENIYRYFTNTFSGVFHEGSWYVLAESIFHEADTEEDVMERMNLQLASWVETGTEHMFKPFAEDINHPFGKLPWHVGYLKEEAKTKLNNSYESYINESVFIPLLVFLRQKDADSFAETHGLFKHPQYPLLYPHSKKQVMAVIKAETAEGNSRLYYFFYHPVSRKVYEWIRPQVRTAAGFHVFYILEDIAPYCKWKDCSDIYESHITMDDDTFWNEHVMKKNENGEYLYLKEVEYINTQPDIYPDL